MGSPAAAGLEYTVTSENMGTAPIPIAVMEGDDIGPEIVRETVKVLDAAAARQDASIGWRPLPAGLSALAEYGSTLPGHTIAALREIPGWILGPVSHLEYPVGDPRYINPSGHLRKHFSLYSNVRPCRGWPGVQAMRPDLDLVIVRENTEGFYADRNVLDGNGELRPDEDTVISVRVVTRRACRNVVREAFELATRPGRAKRVTAVHKANVLKYGDGLFLECFREIAAGYPDVVIDDFLVDAFAMRLILRPDDHDVVVTTNMFGDILSDEAAGLVGGLGLAPGLNIGADHAMGQAVHGSAPDIAGTMTANPIAEILSGALLLDWLGRTSADPRAVAAGQDIQRAISDVLAAGAHMTRDLGGHASTDEMGDAIVAAVVALP
jgi:3-isopropylmalate dehydrogenase